MKSERQRNGNISFVSVVGGKKIDFFLFEIKKMLSVIIFRLLVGCLPLLPSVLSSLFSFDSF